MKLHLAFADKSAPVTEEFSTPQAICVVHWTSESQQAPRRTQGIFLFRVEGWGNHSIGWAKGLNSYALGRARVSGMGVVWSQRPQGELRASHFSNLWPIFSGDTKTWERDHVTPPKFILIWWRMGGFDTWLRLLAKIKLGHYSSFQCILHSKVSRSPQDKKLQLGLVWQRPLKSSHSGSNKCNTWSDPISEDKAELDTTLLWPKVTNLLMPLWKKKKSTILATNSRSNTTT